jgi:hypothetical protein
VNRRHPRIKLFFKTPGQKTHIGTTNWHKWSIHGESLIAVLLNYLLKPSGDREHGFSGTSATVKGYDSNLRVKQKFKRKTLFFVSGPKTPCFGG